MDPLRNIVISTSTGHVFAPGSVAAISPLRHQMVNSLQHFEFTVYGVGFELIIVAQTLTGEFSYTYNITPSTHPEWDDYRVKHNVEAGLHFDETQTKAEQVRQEFIDKLLG
jgi:hypothetical protein